MAAVGMYAGIPLNDIANSNLFYAIAGLGGLDWIVARFVQNKAQTKTQ